MFAIIILALLPRALAQTKVITGIDCQIDSKNKDLLSETWKRTKFGEGGVKNGDDGKLFQFDCQKRCYDSDNDMGKYWMTCGYTWKHIKDLLPNDEVVVDVRTEAYDDKGSCRDSTYKKAMSLDATGNNAVDTFGQDGHYGFFLCYRTQPWKTSFKRKIQYISDLKAETAQSADLPNGEIKDGSWELIGKWDTHNDADNFAYGDHKRTGHWMYFYRKRKMHAAVTLVGAWKSKTFSLKPWEEKITITYSTTITEASELTKEEKKHWESTVSSGHTVSTSLSASGSYKGVDLAAEVGYEYTKKYEEKKSLDTAIKSYVKKSLKSDFKETRTYTIPPVGKDTSYTFYYFVVEARSKDEYGTNVVTGFGGSKIEGILTNNICGRELPPNCFPLLQCADDKKCWDCNTEQAVINPNFREPYYCEEGEGCDWIPINANECPSLKDILKLKRCGPTNDHGQICEGTEGKLINGKNSEINNCYGQYDIFRFDCPRAPYSVTISSGSTSVEVTIAVVGDDKANLEVDKGEFKGEWGIMSEGIMSEGTRQFSDRKYILEGVPDHLDGAKYWKGPCHSRGASFTVHTTGTVYLLASHGNSAVGSGKSPFVFTPKPQSTTTISMRTTSFPSESKFEEWVFDKADIVGAGNTADLDESVGLSSIWDDMTDGVSAGVDLVEDGASATVDFAEDVWDWLSEEQEGDSVGTGNTAGLGGSVGLSNGPTPCSSDDDCGEGKHCYQAGDAGSMCIDNNMLGSTSVAAGVDKHCAELKAKYPECVDGYEGSTPCKPSQEDVNYLSSNCPVGDDSDDIDEPDNSDGSYSDETAALDSESIDYDTDSDASQKDSDEPDDSQNQTRERYERGEESSVSNTDADITMDLLSERNFSFSHNAIIFMAAIGFIATLQHMYNQCNIRSKYLEISFDEEAA